MAKTGSTAHMTSKVCLKISLGSDVETNNFTLEKYSWIRSSRTGFAEMKTNSAQIQLKLCFVWVDNARLCGGC